MKNHENLNNIKSKGKPKQFIKQRGYYYSSANINKRQANKKQLSEKNKNFSNDMVEDFFPKQTNAFLNESNNSNNNKNKTNTNINDETNNLELFNKNMLLLNYIEAKRKKVKNVLNYLKYINYRIGNIILKPKIRNFEINKKIIREKEKKEQDELNFNRNISDKIDAALNKANLALDNIKYFGKSIYPKQQIFNVDNDVRNINLINNINTKYNYNEFKKEKEKINIINISQKCLDKYEENIQINNNNHDEYFITISKTRKLFKDSKEQLQSMKYRLRNSGIFFEKIYKKKNNNYQEEPKTLIHLNKEIFFKENNFIKINSFLKSEIFQKLFVKVIYNENFIQNINLQNINNNNIKNNSFNDTDIYNIFSLWYIFKEIILLINQISNNNFLNFIFIDNNINETIFGSIDNINNKENIRNDLFLKYIIIDFIERYLSFLNKKNNTSPDNNESKVFTNDYHKLYEILFKLEQSKLIDFIIENIEKKNINKTENISKEKLNYYRNIQSIFINKGKYICSIINKLNK